MSFTEQDTMKNIYGDVPALLSDFAAAAREMGNRTGVEIGELDRIPKLDILDVQNICARWAHVLTKSFQVVEASLKETPGERTKILLEDTKNTYRKCVNAIAHMDQRIQKYATSVSVWDLSIFQKCKHLYRGAAVLTKLNVGSYIRGIRTLLYEMQARVESCFDVITIRMVIDHQRGRKEMDLQQEEKTAMVKKKIALGLDKFKRKKDSQAGMPRSFGMEEGAPIEMTNEFGNAYMGNTDDEEY